MQSQHLVGSHWQVLRALRLSKNTTACCSARQKQQLTYHGHPHRLRSASCRNWRRSEAVCSGTPSNRGGSRSQGSERSTWPALAPAAALASGLAMLCALCAALPPPPALLSGFPALAFVVLLRLRLPRHRLLRTRPGAEGGSGGGGSGGSGSGSGAGSGDSGLLAAMMGKSAVHKKMGGGERGSQNGAALEQSRQDLSGGGAGVDGVDESGDAEGTSMMDSVGDAIEEALGELSRVDTAASVWLPNRSANFQYYKPSHTPTLRIGSAAVTMSGRVWRILMMVLRLPLELLSLASFNAQQVMLGSTMTKLISVFAVGLPLCLLGGLAYSAASGKSFLQGCLQAYAALYKIPGCTVLGEVNALTANVMNVLWLTGTFTFAIVLGVVTEDITNTVLAIRSGNYQVVAANHTLVLNWNAQTVPLLRQIAINRTERGEGTYPGPVVVLAERDKVEMDRELRRELGHQPNLEWHTRYGAPHSIADLERVGAGQARTIILMHPDIGTGNEGGSGAGKKQVVAMLGVQTLRASTRPRPFLRLSKQHLAVQAPESKDDGQLFAAVKRIMQSSAQKLALTQLSGGRDMSMLLAQSAVSPGIASVYSSIVQQTRSGVEFYIRGFPDLEGLSYGAARRAFPDAAVVGYQSKAAGGTLRMNPPDADVLGDGDAIIALTKTGFFKPRLPKRDTDARRRLGEAPVRPADLQPVLQTLKPNRQLPAAGSSSATSAASPGKEGDSSPNGFGAVGGAGKAGAKRLVVTWWGDSDIGILARSLAAFAPRGSRISVVAQAKPEGFPEKQELGTAVRFAFVEGDPADLAVLKKAEVGSAAAVVVAGLAERNSKEADALVLTTLLLVQELAGEAKRDASNPTHVVGTVRQPETVEVANFLLDRMGRGAVSAELLQPDELVAAIIAQVAAEPAMGNLLSGFIYAANGQEIYLRRPDAYRLVGCTAAFEQVAELAREQPRPETAIGYITQGGAMRLAPRATNQHKYQANDRIVVVANAGS